MGQKSFPTTLGQHLLWQKVEKKEGGEENKKSHTLNKNEEEGEEKV